MRAFLPHFARIFSFFFERVKKTYKNALGKKKEIRHFFLFFVALPLLFSKNNYFSLPVFATMLLHFFLFMQKFFAFLLLFLCVSPVYAFTDTESKAITRLVEKGVVHEKQYFLPNIPCTRGQFVLWAMRNAGYNLDGRRFSEPFSDVLPSQKYAPYIGKAWQMGILDTKTKFHPHDAITTLDALRILLSLENISFSHAQSDLSAPDAPKTEKERRIIEKALEMGLLRPQKNGLLGTYFSLNRYECAKMIDGISLKKGLHIVFTPTHKENTRPKHASEIDVLEQVVDAIESRYLHRDKIDTNALLENAIRQFVSSLGDPHTIYFNKKEVQNFLMSVGEGNQSGIGAQVGIDELGRVQIIKPLRGSPAEQAGVQPGDVVYKVNGIDVISAGMTLEETIAFIKGPNGSDVKIIFLRRGREIPITITRAPIQPSSLFAQVHNGYLVLELDFFGADTESEFVKAITENPEAAQKGILLDLRNNPGGFLQTAIDILSHILPEGTIAVKTRAIDALHTETVQGPADFSTQPLVVLVNSRSASASEILAGAVQDNARAAIVGTQTYGKGTAQQLISLANGAALKLTIAEWLTPNGRNIDGVGISPDYIYENINEGNDVYDFAERLIERNQWKPTN